MAAASLRLRMPEPRTTRLLDRQHRTTAPEIGVRCAGARAEEIEWSRRAGLTRLQSWVRTCGAKRLRRCTTRRRRRCLRQACSNPTVALLEELADGGPALEFAVGTGRVALPLSARGVVVHGVELSAPMAARLAEKPHAAAVHVTIGDMTAAHVEGDFKLVYVVWNALMNVTTQEEQVAVFRNAARHLGPGGRFVVEVVVPQIRGVPPGEVGRVFVFEPDHVAVETFDDFVSQISWSHHWMSIDGRLMHHATPGRYVWPAELDLMAQIAGLTLCERWGGWKREPFTADSTNQVVVYEHS
jgi:SAM-dependent methyltransferase